MLSSQVKKLSTTSKLKTGALGLLFFIGPYLKLGNITSMSTLATLTITPKDTLPALKAALDFYKAALAGDFATALAPFAKNFNDFEEFTSSITELLGKFTTPNYPDVQVTTTEDGYTITAPKDFIIPGKNLNASPLHYALDIFIRVGIGQFGRLAELSTSTDVWSTRERLETLRLAYQKPDTYPPHLHASWGIYNPRVSKDVNSAYDLICALNKTEFKAIGTAPTLTLTQSATQAL